MILEAKGLYFSYRSNDVLQNVTFTVRENELLAILGPNGSGKTTLLKCINAILKPRAGLIQLENNSILSLSGRDIAKNIAYVAQRNETTRLTAFDAILLGRKPYIRWQVSENDMNIVNAAIDKLDLKKLSLRYIDQMSGGELQKVCIARALVQEPSILLLDEPTSSLDLKNQVSILRLIREVVKGHNISAIMTMHDINLALRYADKFIFLREGTIFAAVEKKDITAEIIEAVYGVDVIIEYYGDTTIIIPFE